MNIYRTRFPLFASHIIFFESRILPFVFIYIITILHTFINSVNSPMWPYSAYVEILDGRYTNIIFYSFILYMVLRFIPKPFVGTALFITGSILYYLLDKFLHLHLFGYSIILYKLLKIMIFFTGLIFEYYTIALIYPLLLSFFIGLIALSGTIGIYIGLFNNSTTYLVKRDIEFKLLRLGIPYKVQLFKLLLLQNANYTDVGQFVYFLNKLHYKLPFTQNEWTKLLFSKDLNLSNLTALLLLKENVQISYHQLLDHVNTLSMNSNFTLELSSGLAQLALRFADNNEKVLITYFKKGNLLFKLWCMNIMSYHKKNIYIPLLLPYCAHPHPSIAANAYNTLTHITGKNPSAELNLPYNNPLVINTFRDFYFQIGNMK